MATSSLEESPERPESDEREATELSNYEGVEDSNGATTLRSRETVLCNAGRDHVYFRSLGKAMKHFWQHRITATVAHDACRDHLGTLDLF